MASNMKESLFVRIRRWYTDGGVLKMIGRTFLLIGIIIALAFASVGYVNMLNTRNADQAAKYEENVKKAQDRAYKQLVKDAKTAEKNGEVPPEIPEDASMIEVEVKPVELDLTNYLSEYLATDFIRAVAALVEPGKSEKPEEETGWFRTSYIKPATAAGKEVTFRMQGQSTETFRYTIATSNPKGTTLRLSLNSANGGKDEVTIKLQ